MCGISLIINKDNSRVNEDVLYAFNKKIAHRGPDDEGFYYYQGVGMGHRRLAILDLSSAGSQPMTYGGRYVINFNGCIFNYIELRDELKGLGYTFSTGTDTEVIPAAYDRWGQQCTQRFNGMWSFYILDLSEQLIFASRDRFGLKPFYYYDTAGCFAACSEIKQLTVLPGFRPVINPGVAADFLEKGEMNYSQETFFKGVLELPAGHQLVYRLSSHTFSIYRWYDLSAAVYAQKSSFSEARKGVKELLSDAVRLRLRADVKAGAGLSGGIDSSLIVCLVNKLKKYASAPFTTISVLYRDRSIDESDFVHAVSAQTGQPAIELYPEPGDLFDSRALNRMVYYQDQPVPALSHFNEFKVFETAQSNGLKVFLDGHGADEVFAGYQNYGQYYLMILFRKGKWMRLLRELFFRLGRNFAEGQVSRSVSDLGQLRKMPADYVPAVMPAQQQPGIRELSIDQLMRSSLPYQIHSYDRSSMMHSVEGRCPFMDHRLIEYVLGLPDDYKIRRGVTKYILREAAKNTVPAQVYRRKNKLGFPAPEEAFMQANQHYVARKFQEAVRTQNTFIPARLLQDFIDFNEQRARYDNRFFRYLTFILWIEEFKVALTDEQAVAKILDGRPNLHKQVS